MLRHWTGLTLAALAMLFQLLIFWQVLLPKAWQLTPVCLQIVNALAVAPEDPTPAGDHPVSIHHDPAHRSAEAHAMSALPNPDHLIQPHQQADANDHSHVMMDHVHKTHTDHHKKSTAPHDCPFCLLHIQISGPDGLSRQLEQQVISWLIQLRQLWAAVYFVLQQLYLLPQGRAPPLL